MSLRLFKSTFTENLSLLPPDKFWIAKAATKSTKQRIPVPAAKIRNVPSVSEHKPLPEGPATSKV